MAVGKVVAAYAANKVGHRVGDGECWTLAENALKNAHAKTSNDMMGADGVNSDADYVWGTPTTLANLTPGDIVQFNYYTEQITVSEDDPKTNTRGEPRHTAIVASVGKDGAVTVYEQNVPDGKGVIKTTLHFTTTGNVVVSGNWWFYKPVPKP